MKESSRRKNPARHRWEWVFIGVLAVIMLVAAFLLYRPMEGAAVAVISVDGNEVRRVHLASAPDAVVSLLQETGKPVSYEVKDGKIRFVDVVCPDHLCEKAGWCDAAGERAVCMPNRTVLVCYSAEELP